MQVVTKIQCGLRLYGLRVTEAQVNRVAFLNERFNESLTIGDPMDFVEIVSPDKADMITGRWGNIQIGILPDGSAHS